MPTKKAVKKVATKKVAKKAVAKKAPKKVSKKTAKKAVNKKSLVFANETNSFWVSDGQILNSLLALRDALSSMDKDIYLYHATGDKNDFSLWVSSVLCDEACAKDLAKAKTPKTAQTTVIKYLKLYEF